MIRLFAYVNPVGNPVTSIGFLSRNPTPPGLSTAVTEIGVIGSFFVTVAPFAVIVGPTVSRAVTVKLKFTGSALFPSLSAALNVIVFCLPISSAEVVIEIRTTFSVSVVFTGVEVALPAFIRPKYLSKKSLAFNVTEVLSFAVTVNSTFPPSTTV